MPIFLVPFLGWFLDRFGLRTDLLVLSTATFTVSMVLLGFTMVNPLVGLVTFSVSLALGPLAEITAISLLLPASSLGTGLGIYKSATNIGSTIVDIVVGALQDNGPKSVAESQHSYRYVMAFFVGWGALSMAVATAIFVVDRFQWGGLLRGNAAERKEALHVVKDKINEPLLLAAAPNWRSYVRKRNVFPLGVLVVSLVISLVLFALKLM
ncbi:hypothetical protein EC988_000911 [Linderina pennispora]|nr:hypothetical protein EC988_000911 [Linderina pennispora]